MNLKELAALVGLGALWGASYVFIRVAVPEIGPFALMEARVILGVAALVAFAALTGRLSSFKGRKKSFLTLGGLNAAIPFTLIAAAEIYIPASLAAILNSTTALFVAAVAVAWIGEEMTVRKTLGLFSGVFGVTVLVGWTPISFGWSTLFAVGAMLLASFAYALGGVYARKNFSGPPVELAIGQLSGAAILLFIPALLTLPEELPSAPATLSVLGLAFLSTAAAYLLYFYLITGVGPTKTLTVTFLIPVFGLLLGVVLLGEPVGAGTFVGLAVILASIALVNDVRLRKTSAGTVE